MRCYLSAGNARLFAHGDRGADDYGQQTGSLPDLAAISR
jgi:hypothetical protein